jgi:aminoglycoside/choline kinase family phosphotransferase
MDKVITGSDDLTQEWLTFALQQGGKLNSSVTSLEVEHGIAAGVGLMGELARIRLQYSDNESLPASMIVKCAVQNQNKEIAKVLDFYNREVNFYNKIGEACGFRVPASYYADVDQDSYDCVILMEDLGNVSPHDQIEGATEEEAYAAVEKIAIMHSKYWNKVSTPESSWMYDFMCEAEAEKLRDMVYMPALEPALEKFAEFFDDDQRDLCRAVGERYPEFWSTRLSDFETFIHGDYRQDNFIYPGGSLDSIVMDWQISGKGKGIFDVSYFICQSLQSDLRQKIEHDLIRRYVDRLIEYGITDYDFDLAFKDYRIMMLGCLVYPITVCGTLDLANERGRALAECMLTRNLNAIKELDCASLLS